MEQLLRHPRGTNNMSLRLEPHAMMRENTIELVCRSDVDSAGDSATRQSITGFHCNLQGVVICNRSLKQTVISLNSSETEFYFASACEAKLLGLAELFKQLHHTVSMKF